MQITLHQHDLANFMACPCLYNLTSNLGYRTKTLKKAINIGDLFTKGVELLHLDQPLANAMLLVKKQQDDLLLQATKQEHIDNINTDTSTVQAMLYGYDKKWLRVPRYKVQPEHNVTWRFKRFGVYVTYINSLDGRLLDVAQHPWILEIKTAAKMVKDLLLELPTNFQINSYWLSNYKANNEMAYGIVYRFVVKPTIRQKQTENADQFQKRVIGEYEQNTTKYFFEETLFVDKSALKRFEADINMVFEDLILAHVKKRWPRKGNACMSKYGSLCDFIRYCGDPTEETLQTYYIKGDKE